MGPLYVLKTLDPQKKMEFFAKQKKKKALGGIFVQKKLFSPDYLHS